MSKEKATAQTSTATVVSPKLKWFVSAIIPGVRQVGIMQFEATEAEYKNKAEELCPVRASFRPYKIEEFDDELPVGEFINIVSAKKLGY